MKFIPHLQKHTGFSLIEFLLYMSLSTIMIALLGGIGINVLYGREKAKALEEMQYSIPYLMTLQSSRIEEAERVIVPEEGETSSYLSLETADPDTNPTIIDIYDGLVRMREGEHEPVFLTTERIVVTNLSFVYTGESGKAEGVRIVLEVSPRTGEEQPASPTRFDFRTTATSRK